MPYVLIRHKVEDYERWKPALDAHGAARKASGSKGGRLLRSGEDPNELVIMLEWDNLQKAGSLLNRTPFETRCGGQGS